ncbi:hypothetical protein ACHAQH_008834 [Verticillium albo-atrum]
MPRLKKGVRDNSQHKRYAGLAPYSPGKVDVRDQILHRGREDNATEARPRDRGSQSQRAAFPEVRPDDGDARHEYGVHIEARDDALRKQDMLVDLHMLARYVPTMAMTEPMKTMWRALPAFVSRSEIVLMTEKRKTWMEPIQETSASWRDSASV